MPGIACRHVRVLEHNARWMVHAQVQQEWAQIVELERPAQVSWKRGILLGEERAGQGAIQERAILVLIMEVAARGCWSAGRAQGKL